jgi:hypothetical protein
MIVFFVLLKNRLDSKNTTGARKKIANVQVWGTAKYWC